MPLSDIVRVTISTEGVALTQAGFGMPMVLAFDPPAGFTERVRFYSSAADLVTDGFDTAGPTHKMVAAVFAQSPRPEEVAVGRCESAVGAVQQWAVTPANVAEGKKFKVEVDGHEVTVTAGNGDVVADVVDDLKTAIDALSLTGITTSDQTTFLRITGAAHKFHTVRTTTLPIANLLVDQDHADNDVDDDLDAILLENGDWYCILNPYASDAMLVTIATWAESNEKLFVAQTQNTRVITVATGSDTGGTETAAKSVAASARVRTAVLYHPDNGVFLDAALAGRCLPTAPGSETWNLKTLSGPDATNLTTTHKTNAEAKNCGYYLSLAGVSVSREGKVASGTYIDVVRGRDWLKARMQERIFGLLARVDKIPYTNKGAATIKAEVDAQLREGVKVGLLSDDPAPTSSVPDVNDVDSVDKAARILPDVRFTATLAGAVHEVEISGAVTV